VRYLPSVTIFVTNRFRVKNIRMTKLFVFTFTLAVFGVFAQQNPLSTSLKFKEVIDQIERNYVDPVDTKKLTETAIVALLEKLDPHSTYIPAEEAQEAQSQINGSFVGIGIRFQIVKDTLMVVATKKQCLEF